jgi:SP family xylose:H+ symportor-like MFS transporter
MKNKNLNIILISFVAAMGGYLFGFDFAVISGTLPFLRESFGLDAFWEGFTAASLAIGAIIGCLIAGAYSERYGRRSALMISAAVFMISSLGMGVSPSLVTFICARFLAGVGVGMASMLSPMYIAEISPANVRGRMVAINQLTIVIGILFTNVVNYLLRNQGHEAWRIMFSLGAMPSLVFLLGVIWLPESPRWLMKAGKYDKAEAVLHKLGNGDFVKETIGSIQKSLTGETNINYAAVFEKEYLPIVMVGITLAVFQQLCGINVVFSYTSNIFESIGASKSDQLLQTVFIGVVNLIFTLLAMQLVDRVGRKPLMLIGSIGLSSLYIVISLMLGAKSVFTAIFLLSAIALYATTLAPVTWVLIAEIFPNKVRSAATAVAVLCLWTGYFILMFTFPILEKWIGTNNTFYVYAGICILGFIFISLRVKETKGRTLEEMDNIFVH